VGNGKTIKQKNSNYQFYNSTLFGDFFFPTFAGGFIFHSLKIFPIWENTDFFS
jgi:hypothetical protein